MNNKPEEYIEGSVDFFYNTFFVSEYSLIPRLETEVLVRKAIELSKKHNYDYLIDVGAGVGIIPISINLNEEIPEVFGLDIKLGALKVGEKNSKNLKTKVKFKKSDLLEFFLKKTKYSSGETKIKNGSKVLFTANLPYIAPSERKYMGLDVLLNEPDSALFGGEDTGFELYEKLFNQIIEFAGKYELSKVDFIFEIGEYQQDIAREFFQKIGVFDYKFIKDYSGIDRFICGSLDLENALTPALSQK